MEEQGYQKIPVTPILLTKGIYIDDEGEAFIIEGGNRQ